MDKIIKLTNAELGYPNTLVLKDVSFEIFNGDFLGIIGPNGAGKSTLIKSIMGLIKLRKGFCENFKVLNYGYCMQREFLSTIFPFTVIEIVKMIRTKYCKTFRGFSNHDIDICLESLEQCGIKELAEMQFSNLSGGQKQRVLLARALALEPDILLLDEPTIDLDVRGKKEILDLIYKLYKEKNLTVILISHELNHVINYASKFLFLVDNQCKGVYKRNDFSSQMLSEIFNTELELIKYNDKELVI